MLITHDHISHERLTSPIMNPQVEAAWIAAASGVVGVLVGVA
jgi:hypothetical protein